MAEQGGIDRHGFSDKQWRQLQQALSDALAYVSQSDPGLISRFRELSATARYLSHQRHDHTTQFIEDLSRTLIAELDKKFPGDKDEVAAQVSSEIAAAYALVRAIQPAEAAGFRDLVQGAAQVAAEASKGVSADEAHALAVIAKAFE
jgi:hypothetical protein